jgi:hypothetical protein
VRKRSGPTLTGGAFTAPSGSVIDIIRKV